MAKFNVQAANDYVITSPVKEDVNKDFDVIDSNKKPDGLLVVSVGKDVTACKAGDKVIPFGQEFAGFNYEGEQYIVLTEAQVLGVIK